MKLTTKEIRLDVTRLATDDPQVRQDILRKAQERNERKAQTTWDRMAEAAQIKRVRDEAKREFLMYLLLFTVSIFVTLAVCYWVSL